jgi:hypothetical protein
MNIDKPRIRKKEYYVRTLFDTADEQEEAMNLFKNIAYQSAMQKQNGKILIAALRHYYKATGGKQ